MLYNGLRLIARCIAGFISIFIYPMKHGQMKGACAGICELFIVAIFLAGVFYICTLIPQLQ